MLKQKNSEFFHSLKIYFIISRNKNIEITFSSHTHINGLLGILRFLRIFKTRKLVARESTTIFSRFNGINLIIFKILYWTGYRYNDLLICQTAKMRNELVRNLKIAKKWKIEVIQNPFYITIKESHNEFTIQEKLIVAAGRLIKIKGFDILIDAFTKISLNYRAPEIIILGEGRKRELLEKKIKYQHNIKLLGHSIIPFLILSG